MAERRRYSARTKAKAVGIAVVEGVTAAERSTGIPKQTIHQWVDRPEYGQLRTTAREVVVAELWVGLQVGVRELTAGLAGDAPLNHKAAAFDSLAERYALLNGEATARHENRDLSTSLNDHETLALRDAIDQVLQPAEPEKATPAGRWDATS